MIVLALSEIHEALEALGQGREDQGREREGRRRPEQTR
jgi:hypothetical protein